ncbi:MAG: prepilin peptidase [Elusimicrobia bacterium]|nr:prepilin peptidase [Elusimicrobiota bacterium]
MSLAALVLIFFLGLCAGSFLNVVIHRLPLEISVVRPGSRCPRCQAPIAFYDNIPILSYILLGARCRRCREPISLRYPLVELLTGGLFAGLAYRWDGLWLWIAAVLLAASALIALSFIDLDTFTIPDALSLGLAGLGLLSSAINPYFSGPWSARLLQCLAGALTGFLLTWATAVLGEKIFKKEALGGGDIKLLTGIGALTGWTGAITTLTTACLFGSIYGVVLMSRRRLKRYDPVPFGPFLSLGALINLFYLIPLQLFALF